MTLTGHKGKTARRAGVHIIATSWHTWVTVADIPAHALLAVISEYCLCLCRKNGPPTVAMMPHCVLEPHACSIPCEVASDIHWLLVVHSALLLCRHHLRLWQSMLDGVFVCSSAPKHQCLLITMCERRTKKLVCLGLRTWPPTWPCASLMQNLLRCACIVTCHCDHHWGLFGSKFCLLLSFRLGG